MGKIKNKLLNDETKLQRDGVIHKFILLNGGKYHYHKQVELIYVVSGKLKLFYGNHKKVLRKNDLAVIKPYELHSFKQLFFGKTLDIILPDDKSLFFASKDIKTEIVKDEKSDGRHLFNIKRKAFKKFSNSTKKIYFSAICDYISLILKSKFKILDEIDSNFTKLMLYINKNYSNQLTLEQTAKECNLTRCYVSNSINKAFNQNFNTFINGKRLAKFVAIYYDNISDKTIEQIAYNVGFNSPATFYRAFEKEFDMTPTEYFKSLKK